MSIETNLMKMIRGLATDYLLGNTDLEVVKMQIKYANEVLNNEQKEISKSSFPTKDEAVAEGYRIANDVGYSYRRVLKDPDNDIYYSGWLDCFDWIISR